MAGDRKALRLALGAAALLTVLAAATPALAQDGTHGALRVITVEAPTTLVGNLQGVPTEREAVVYLPPSYGQDPQRRYPVVYMLHDFGTSAAEWAETLGWPQSADRAMAAAGGREMILVIPDARTANGGAMYTPSVTTGDWERFVTHDLPLGVDAQLLTQPDNRGLAGHLSGGYGALRIGMHGPRAFQAVYAMSPCCVAPRMTGGVSSPKAEGLRTVEELAASEDAGVRIVMGWAAAWSPNPSKPPFYLDLPTQDGADRPDVLAIWHANALLTILPQYAQNLRRLGALAIDIGARDSMLPENDTLHQRLEAFGVPHSYETYDGGHFDRIPERVETRVIPFFAAQLFPAE